MFFLLYEVLKSFGEMMVKLLNIDSCIKPYEFIAAIAMIIGNNMIISFTKMSIINNHMSVKGKHVVRVNNTFKKFPVRITL